MVVMRKARPRRPSIQYSRVVSSAPAVGQEESEVGPASSGGGGGWSDASARWAVANAAERTSAIFVCGWERKINKCGASVRRQSNNSKHKTNCHLTNLTMKGLAFLLLGLAAAAVEAIYPSDHWSFR